MRLAPGTSRADYEAVLAEVRREKRSETVHPPEEICSRESMRKADFQPRILLTNVKQLELLLTRQRDVELFANARLDHLVFDEAHTFTGAQGAETACLIRRLRSFCGKDASEAVCVATSATIVDREHPGAARDFAARFFGVPESAIATVGEAYEPQVWGTHRTLPPAPSSDPNEVLAACVRAVDGGNDGENDAESELRAAFRALAGSDLGAGRISTALHRALSANELVYQIAEALASPHALVDLPPGLEKAAGRTVTEAEILAWLTLGAAARNEGVPLLRPVVHGFVRGISGAVVSFPRDAGDTDEPKLWLAAEDELQADGETHAHFPVTTCTTCGRRISANYREPARPVRATNVADVHVLAQDMVHHSERPRLLVFCDNRQDAAFQAGWMKDHARRFRLRALMADGLRNGAASIGDLAYHLDDLLNKDESLSRALVPEVWQVVRREGGGGRHEKERRKFLRFQVLREITQSARQPIGLEPWGRMTVEYEGLDENLPWIESNVAALGLSPRELNEGVASILDYFRRRRILFDSDWQIFSKYWKDGDEEIQQGYLPQMGNHRDQTAAIAH
jgi:hypothetical protein